MLAHAQGSLDPLGCEKGSHISLCLTHVETSTGVCKRTFQTLQHTLKRFSHSTARDHLEIFFDTGKA